MDLKIPPYKVDFVMPSKGDIINLRYRDRDGSELEATAEVKRAWCSGDDWNTVTMTFRTFNGQILKTPRPKFKPGYEPRSRLSALAA